jgi:hypothetical protein
LVLAEQVAHRLAAELKVTMLLLEAKLLFGRFLQRVAVVAEREP